LTLPVETLKSVRPGKAVWNANGGFVSVLLTHLFYFSSIFVWFLKNSDSDQNEFSSVCFDSNITVMYLLLMYCSVSTTMNKLCIQDFDIVVNDLQQSHCVSSTSTC